MFNLNFDICHVDFREILTKSGCLSFNPIIPVNIAWKCTYSRQSNSIKVARRQQSNVQYEREKMMGFITKY